jgi:hypothetical protein
MNSGGAGAGGTGATGGGGQLDDGAACQSGSQCKSGHCPMPEAVCCNSACAGLCMRCMGTGFPAGECWPVFHGMDPDNECTGSSSVCLTQNLPPECS